jgi:hypothetical protein
MPAFYVQRKTPTDPKETTQGATAVVIYDAPSEAEARQLGASQLGVSQFDVDVTVYAPNFGGGVTVPPSNVPLPEKPI